MNDVEPTADASFIRVRILVPLLAAAVLLAVALCATAAHAAVIHHFERELTGFNEPHAVAVGPEGDLYVAGAVNSETPAAFVERLTPEGQPAPFECKTVACEAYVEGDKLELPAALHGGPADRGLAVDQASGDIYVGVGAHQDFTTTSVLVFAPSGERLSTWTGADTPSGSFGTSTEVGGIAVDESAAPGAWSTGDVLVAVNGGATGFNVVDVFKPLPGGGEEYVTQLTGPEPGVEFQGPGSVAVEPASGDVLVVDEQHQEYGLGEVVDVFSPFGAPIAQWKGAETPAETFGGELALATDPDSGHLYVSGSGRVERVVDEFEVSPLGGEAYIGQITGTPSGPFTNPKAVAVAPGVPHDVLVADRESGALGVVDVFGEDVVVPEATVAAASAVKPESVVLNGSLNPGGAGEATCSFEYGTSTSYGQKVECAGPGSKGSPIPSGSSAVAVSAPVGRLAPDTTYFYRLVGENANGVNTGITRADKGQVTTAGPGVQSESVSVVTSTSAALEASIDPHDGLGSVSHGAVESYYFQYSNGSVAGCTASSCVSVPLAPVALGEGEAPVGVRQPLVGLEPGTVYHYRVVAVSEPSAGVVEEFAGREGSFTTQPASYPALLDGRGWELVSPSEKHGGQIVTEYEPSGYGPEGYAFQAAGDGEAVTYLASAPTEPVAEGNANVSQVLSLRLPGGGWESRDLNPPHIAATRLSVGRGGEYRVFSSDLSTAILQPQGSFTPSMSPAASEQTAFLRTNFSPGDPDAFCTEACYRPLVTGCPGSGSCAAGVAALADVPPGTVFGGESPCISGFICGPLFQMATADLSHVVLSQGSLLGPSGSGENLYEFSTEAPAHEALRPVSVFPAGEVATSTASLPLGISADGSRVFWKNGARIYVRDTVTGQTLRLDQGAGTQEGTFTFAAATDGSRAVYVESGELWECRIVEAAGGGLECERTEIAGGALDEDKSLLGASEDLAYLYFASSEAIAGAAPNQAGQEPQAGRPNLYLYHEGVYTFIATATVDPGYWVGQLARVAPDGRWLAFSTAENPTGYENTGPRCVPAVNGGGAPIPDDFKPGACQEVYLYHAAEGGPGSLDCASCNPTGEPPAGPSTLPVVPNPYLDDSGRLFFNSSDALVPADADGVQDVYEYEPPGVGSCEESSVAFAQRDGGCIGLISSGRSDQDSEFIAASTDGDDVFFRTSARLSPRDVDTYPDIYDARVGGGESEPPKPVECLGDACQQPASAPEDATPGSLSYVGPAEEAAQPAEKPAATKKHAKTVKRRPHKHKAKHKRPRHKSARRTRASNRTPRQRPRSKR